MKASPRIRYDAGAGVALLDEKGQATLRFLYDTYGITWMEFATVLRYSDGLRYLLVLRRGGGGSWGGDGRLARRRSRRSAACRPFPQVELNA